ncbi:MAG: type II CRISPR RNA-guided endonuclease Cas9, partial [Anaerotignum sp.]|nr:type II CRISPR RNA-guided endonuclease Cas9 [Anaerotignum sp.]
DIRHKMQGWWKMLLDHGLISAEKYKRLTRHTPFDKNEEWGFINRQLVETRQSTKAAAAFLKERYPDTEIVYVKAGMVSEFRQEFDMFKCRSVNDLHHAKDAYLNIVVGNVYSEQFTHEWFMAHRDSYNLKVKTLFSRLP